MTDRRPMTPADLYGFRWISDPQLSPDGGRVAYVLARIDRETDEYRSAIWVVPADGAAEPRRFTAGPRRDNHPRWSPDGTRLLFVSDREGERAQVYVIPADGGEARRVTDAPNGVRAPRWSPDGTRIAHLALTGVDCDVPPEDVVAYHYTEARFKEDGDGRKRGRTHLFVQRLDGGDALQLTEGDDDYREPAWSPDGATLAVVSERAPDRAFRRAPRVYLVPAEGGEPRAVTPSEGQGYAPAFSPDGLSLAYFGHLNPPETGLSTNHRLWRVPVEGGAPVCLTPGWDRSISNEDVNSDARWGASEHRPVWTSDGWIMVLATDRGETHVYAVPADGGEVRPVTCGPRAVDAFALAGERLAYLAAEMLAPGDIYSARADGGEERRLTRANAEFLDRFALSVPEEVAIPSTDGVTVQGWVMRPAGFREGERHPLVLEVHGGPHTAYGHGFFHEFQALAGRGYGVLFTNPRGSTGYGERFAACIAGEWGMRDYADIAAAADWAAAQPWVDPARLGITGGSYGGWMTNWVVGHTDRFRAAVTRRCVSNFASFYGTSDIGPVFAGWMIGGTPWENPEGYRRASPITYVERMRTPLLVIHSEEDHRCAMAQAEELYVALLAVGRPVELVRFPQESHGLTRGGKPARRVENLERVIGWFDRHLAPEGGDGRGSE